MEYIERDKAAKIIKKLAFSQCSPFDKRIAIDGIETVPAADVEKVIRCKNCRFTRYEFSAVRYNEGVFLCARTGLSLFNGNGYCSWAELATDRPIEKEE